jgi:hypothetical protein
LRFEKNKYTKSASFLMDSCQIIKKTATMNCRDVNINLIFYVEGTLPEVDFQKMKMHVDSCAECSAKLTYLTEALVSIDSMKTVEAKPFLFTRIQGRMSARSDIQRKYVFAPLLMVSVLLVGLFIGSVVGRVAINSTTNTIQNEYDVAYLFNDAQLENVEVKLLGE